MNSNVFGIVEGAFTAEEAQELLNSLVNHKIQFHNLRMLRMKERNVDANVDASLERIKELKAAREKALKVIDEAMEKNTLIEINSFLEVKVAKSPVESANEVLA